MAPPPPTIKSSSIRGRRQLPLRRRASAGKSRALSNDSDGTKQGGRDTVIREQARAAAGYVPPRKMGPSRSTPSETRQKLLVHRLQKKSLLPKSLTSRSSQYQRKFLLRPLSCRRLRRLRRYRPHRRPPSNRGSRIKNGNSCLRACWNLQRNGEPKKLRI
jgi:hypothetical protein